MTIPDMQATLRLFMLSAMAMLWHQVSQAQDISATGTPDSTAHVTIIGHITASGENTVTIPDALRERITPDEHAAIADKTASPTAVSGGYRIQVFSDSNPRTAQSEARSKSANISSRFPSIRTYVTYDAPYWRLRVGDFTTYEDASDALSLLKEAFPSYRRELRIVRDHINTVN